MRPLAPLTLLLQVLLAWGLVAACHAPAPKTPRALYDDVLKDLGGPGVGSFDARLIERQNERYALVVKWIEEGRVVTAEDHLWCAGALVESDSSEHLQLAHDLALRAAELGDERGFTFEAYATDKLLVDAEAPFQRYGTVIVYSPVLERFELYPVDPRTTDTLRKSVGVPPLEQLLAEVASLNEQSITRRLRGEKVAPERDDLYPMNRPADPKPGDEDRP